MFADTTRKKRQKSAAYIAYGLSQTLYLFRRLSSTDGFITSWSFCVAAFTLIVAFCRMSVAEAAISTSYVPASTFHCAPSVSYEARSDALKVIVTSAASPSSRTCVLANERIFRIALKVATVERIGCTGCTWHKVLRTANDGIVAGESRHAGTDDEMGLVFNAQCLDNGFLLKRKGKFSNLKNSPHSERNEREI